MTEVKTRKRKSKIREYTEAITIAFLAAMLLRVSVVQAYHVPTGSMKSTVLEGDYLLVNKFIYGILTPDEIPFLHLHIPHVRFPALKEPQQGEIVVFKYPNNPSQNYVKRCIAIGGQTVEIRNGIVYINNKPEGKRKFLRKEYDPVDGTTVLYYHIDGNNGTSYTIRHYQTYDQRSMEMAPVMVPAGHFFMMGDNRDNSSDSRHWGFVPRENVVGEAMVIYWSARQDLPIYHVFDKVRWSRLGTILN